MNSLKMREMSTEVTTEMMNEAIARFMGGVKQIIPEGGLHGYKEGVVLWMCLFSSNADPVRSLEFHTSWDWLMPVYRKVREKAFELKDNAEASQLFAKVMEQILYGTIVDVYLRIYQFITWYNQQKQ